MVAFLVRYMVLVVLVVFAYKKVSGYFCASASYRVRRTRPKVMRLQGILPLDLPARYPKALTEPCSNTLNSLNGRMQAVKIIRKFLKHQSNKQPATYNSLSTLVKLLKSNI
jgi:hypothetical protein